MQACRRASLGSVRPSVLSNCKARSIGGTRSPGLNPACQASKSDGKADKEPGDVGLGLKAVWMGAEVLGNAVGAVKGATNNQRNTTGESSGRLTRDEVIAALKDDYENNYFVTGKGSLGAYLPDAEFRDPFAGFKGTERFRRNVSNLGGMLRDVQIDITDWKEEEDSLKTKWRFSAILDLPWKPRLAAAGGTTHVFDPVTGMVAQHIEDWDVEPGKVVRSLLKPSAKLPTNQWEVGMASLADGDVKGIWLALSSTLIKLSAAGLAMSLPWRLITGEGMPGTSLLGVLLVTGLVTEVLKIAKGMQGGESG